MAIAGRTDIRTEKKNPIHKWSPINSILYSHENSTLYKSFLIISDSVFVVSPMKLGMEINAHIGNLKCVKTEIWTEQF